MGPDDDIAIVETEIQDGLARLKELRTSNDPSYASALDEFAMSITGLQNAVQYSSASNPSFANATLFDAVRYLKQELDAAQHPFIARIAIERVKTAASIMLGERRCPVHELTTDEQMDMWKRILADLAD
jgi:hypothetical protein